MAMSPIEVRTAELRDLKGWSQAELARRSGVSQPTISRAEAGDTSGLSLGVIEKLSTALDVDPSVLIRKRGK